MPKSPACLASCAISAALTRALVGMHPRVIQVPPTAPLSKSATRLPRRRAARTAAQPPMPEPITATSNRRSEPGDPRRPGIAASALRDRASNPVSLGRRLDSEAGHGRKAGSCDVRCHDAPGRFTSLGRHGESLDALVWSKLVTPEQRRAMSEQEIWIEAPDASSAAFLMRHLVGRLRVQLVQCTGRGWRVLVRPDRGRPPSMVDVIALGGVSRSLSSSASSLEESAPTGAACRRRRCCALPR